jgi:hypothetical protein
MEVFMNVEFELNGFTYEIGISHFQSHGKFKWNEPPETGEISLEEVVKVKDGLKFVCEHTISLNEFVELYSVDEGIDLKEARSKLEDYCYDDVCQQHEEDYDDRDI